MLGLIVNPVAWSISTFVIVYVALLGFVSSILGPYDERYRINERIMWGVFLLAIAISALNAVSSIRGGA
ncbi:hypothetical protein NYD60_03275 [Burkholderia thailandensis]|uniref:hypothetical protein n=1 Tax=Burkholderia thailandensis TaxID=57975 RepID=UPI00217E14A4|nr:hypothetical protein [Burkholderia thailandensis]MCS6499030.1 hypothetical protein [Burkholderia thailandensis]